MLVRWSRDLARGYRATWQLLIETFKHPFGEASGWHRVWLLPQAIIIIGLMPLVGCAQGYGPWWEGITATSIIVPIGLLLTALVGRAAARGLFSE